MNNIIEDLFSDILTLEEIIDEESNFYAVTHSEQDSIGIFYSLYEDVDHLVATISFGEEYEPMIRIDNDWDDLPSELAEREFKLMTNISKLIKEYDNYYDGISAEAIAEHAYTNEYPMHEVHIWTDGGVRFDSSKGSVKPDDVGASAWLLKHRDIELIDGEAFKGKTNGFAEIFAVLGGLSALLEEIDSLNNFGNPIVIHSDSSYVVNTLNKEWWVNWKKNGWKTSSGKEVKNKELWKALLEIWEELPSVEIRHVKGHNGNEGNERVDSHVNLLMDELEGAF